MAVKVANKINTKGDAILSFLRRACRTCIVGTSRVKRLIVRPKRSYCRPIVTLFKERVVGGSGAVSHERISSMMFSRPRLLRGLGRVVRPTIGRCVERRLTMGGRRKRGVYIIRTTLLLRSRCRRFYSAV